MENVQRPLSRVARADAARPLHGGVNERDAATCTPTGVTSLMRRRAPRPVPRSAA